MAMSSMAAMAAMIMILMPFPIPSMPMAAIVTGRRRDVHRRRLHDNGTPWFDIDRRGRDEAGQADIHVHIDVGRHAWRSRKHQRHSGQRSKYVLHCVFLRPCRIGCCG